MKNPWRRWWLWTGLVLVSLLLVGVAYAQGGGVTQDDINRVAKQLYCPVCENTPLDVCETQACADWREQIGELLAAGYSDQEVINFFTEQYGDRVRALPRREGFALWVWILPVVGTLAGIVITVRLFRRWMGRRMEAAAAVPIEPSPVRASSDLPEDYVARLERELREWE